jgi:hypothetical protein
VLAKREVDPGLRRLGEGSQRPLPPALAAPKRAGVVHSIWRRRLLVAVLTALALLPAIIYISLSTPRYTSISNLLIRRTVGNGGSSQTQTAGAIDTGAGDTGAMDTAELTAQRNVIVSTPVLAAALAEPGVRDCDPLRDHLDALAFLKRSLIVEIGHGNQVSVSIASIDPDDATSIVKAVVKAYSHFLFSLRRSVNNELIASLQTQ